MTSLHPARRPSFHFIDALIALAEAEGPAVGDVVEVDFEGGCREAKVVQIKGDETWVSYDGGPSEKADGWMYVLHRPSITALFESHLKEANPDGVAYQDGLDPTLQGQLSAAFNRLMDGPADYHPGSGTMVRDLVHPSLYPWINPAHLENAPSASASGEPQKRDIWGRPYESSRFQWLPSTFRVSDTGAVSIPGPINNLRDDGMREPLARLFETFLPLFESVAGYAQTLSFYDDSLEGEHELPEVFKDTQEPITPRSLRGRDLQVITKIIEYRLENEERFEGVWHVEGMSHENILATGVLTLNRDEGLEGGALRFKRAYTLEEAGKAFWTMPQSRPANVDEVIDEGLLPLGSVGSAEGRLVVFPNCHVHKLSPMSVRGGQGTATRRIIVFWLVHPDHPIKGLEDVPRPQDQMSFAQACEARLALMEERRRYKQSQNVRAVSLCEH